MPWLTRLYMLLPILLFIGNVHATEWGEGYDPIDPPVATSVPKGKVEVLEFFWYGCPHCYDMEPYVEKWLKSKPENVVFSLVPWFPHPPNFELNPDLTPEKWEKYRKSIFELRAQYYYAAKLSGLLDKLHHPLFKELLKHKNALTDEKSLIDFAVEHGAERDKFTKVWHSFGVYAKVQSAIKLVNRYTKLNGDPIIDGVPNFTINGKYITSRSLASSYEKMFETINQLVLEESQ
jgi:thiol:disulfide interchange protein DsbA